MPEHPLSVQLYTVRDALAHNLEETLEQVAKVGFTTVELFDFVANARQYAEVLPRLGLSPSSAHVRLLDHDLEPVLEAAQLVGVSTLIEPSIPSETWADPDAVAAAANQLNGIAALAADLGIAVGYHNHWWEFGESDGMTALEAFAELLDPAVVLEVDTYWAEVAGVSAAELLTRLGRRVAFIHVKDGDLTQDDLAQVAVGGGRMPMLSILEAAPHAVPVVELDGFDGDVFDALRASVAWLVSHGQHLETGGGRM